LSENAENKERNKEIPACTVGSINCDFVESSKSFREIGLSSDFTKL